MNPHGHNDADKEIEETMQVAGVTEGFKGLRQQSSPPEG
jgi:hypothetical protein